MDVNSYMNNSIQDLVKRIVKISKNNPKELFYLMKFLKYFKKGIKIREENEEKGEHIPYFIMASIASKCNLNCKGCYFRENMKSKLAIENNQMTSERWKEIFIEAKELGINLALLLGGEPLTRKDVIMEASKIKEILFAVFTNGTLFNEEYIKVFNNNRNLFPIISIEGDMQRTNFRRGSGVAERINKSINNLIDKKIPYGVSITVGKNNIFEVTNEEFVDNLIKKECVVLIYVEYVDADLKSKENVLGEEEREHLQKQINYFREINKEISIIAFPADEEKVGGCLAAGRGFIHINMLGGVEPCPFSSYSDIDLRESSIREALNSKFLKDIRNQNMLSQVHESGCVLWDKRDEVKLIYEKNK